MDFLTGAGVQSVIMLLAGVGILLFGMSIFEESIKVLGGNKVKGLLQKFTNGPFSSVATGTVATALLQSSSLVTLLILAFTGAGVLALYNSIGVIIGANIGTTVSSLLISYLGFGEFKISKLALPILAVGGVMLIFAKSEKRTSISRLLLGFGLLFIGLDFMKTSVDEVRETFDLAQYKDLSLWAFGLLGVIVTAVIQSSSAVGILTLAALSSGIITFEASIAIVMGSNIGTTFTGVIASLGGATIKRQVAFAQVMFNLISSVVGIVFFYQYIYLVNELMGFADKPVQGNAILNSVFNLSTGIAFAFVLKPFTALVERIIPSDSAGASELAISVVDSSPGNGGLFDEAALIALTNDSKIVIDKAFAYNTYMFGIESTKFLQDGAADSEAILETMSIQTDARHDELYDNAKSTANELLPYILSSKPNTETQYNTVYNSLRSIKSLKNIYSDLQELASSTSPELIELYRSLRIQLLTIYIHIGEIVDRSYSSQDFILLKKAFSQLESTHSSFMQQISELSELSTSTDVPLSTLMNIDHYLYKGTKQLIDAVELVYLTAEEQRTIDRNETE